MFDNAPIFAEDSVEQTALRSARKVVDEKGTTCRKHFLDAYAEHLEALKRARTPK